MIAILAASLALSTAGPLPSAVGPDDPPVRIRLSDDFYFRGEKAKVRVKLQRDGYLLVLRLDGAGRVRPLFPLDPDDSSFARGGKEYEIKGRGERESFVVDERDGVGYVFAALSDSPFDLSRFSRGGHWDYRMLSSEEGNGDPQLILLDLADSMATGDFDYDVATYTVGADRRDRGYARTWIGRPWYYDPWYSPFYSPWFGPRYGVSFGVFLGGHRRYHRRW